MLKQNFPRLFSLIVFLDVILHFLIAIRFSVFMTFVSIKGLFDIFDGRFTGSLVPPRDSTIFSSCLGFGSHGLLHLL